MASTNLQQIIEDEVKRLSIEGNRKLIKKMIEDAYQNYKQVAFRLSGRQFSDAQKLYDKASALLESLESYHCGSVGGYDDGQKDQSFIGRLNWISQKLLGESSNFKPLEITVKLNDSLLSSEELK